MSYFVSEASFREVVDLHAKGMSYKKIGKQLGLTKGAVSGIVTRAKRGQSPVATIDVEVHREAITALYLDGVPYRQIAEQVGLKRDRIRDLAKRWALPARENPPPLRRDLAKVRRRPMADVQPPIGPIGDFPERGCCTFIAGEPDKDFQCCGHTGYPFCDAHAAICYQPARESLCAQN